MPMRENCRHFESREYDDGETARFCTLDLAPEAPWRCPDDCPKFEPSLIDGSFVTGSLEQRSVEDEPQGADIAALLDEAEDIVNDAAPDVLQELDGGPRRSRRGWKFWKRPPEDGPFKLSNR
jgi:hypothetical protein